MNSPKWIVVNGEILNDYDDELAGVEVVMVCYAVSFDRAIYQLEKIANVTCVNCDILTEQTAKSYKVPFEKIKRVIYRPTED